MAVVWCFPVVPHLVIVWEVAVNKYCGMWSHRDGFPGVVWYGLVWWGCGVGRWGGCGCGELIGRIVWAVGWLLPCVPHPVVVWDVAVRSTKIVGCGQLTLGRIPRRGLV